MGPSRPDTEVFHNQLDTRLGDENRMNELRNSKRGDAGVRNVEHAVERLVDAVRTQLSIADTHQHSEFKRHDEITY